MRVYFPLLLLAALYTSIRAQGNAIPIKKAVSSLTKPVELFKTPAKQIDLPELPKASEAYMLTPSLKKLQEIYYAAPEYLSLTVPRQDHSEILLILEKVVIFSGDFSIDFHRGKPPKDLSTGLHYQGRIAGREKSIAAISVFADEIHGLWSAGDQTGNWVLSPWKETGEFGTHLAYNDSQIVFNPAFSCKMTDKGQVYEENVVSAKANSKAKKLPCTRLFLEVDYDVFIDQGGSSKTIKYISSLFNQIAAVFSQNEIPVQLSQLYIWNAPSVYNGTDVEDQLQQFQTNRPEWRGDLAQLISYKANGGLAGSFQGICAEERAKSMSYAGIQSAFNSLPNYSWTVNVVAHELGHLMGARHTHACVWNGDGTSIDDCGNVYMHRRGKESEGEICFEASRPKYPSGGGTLMSYCHLLEGVGIRLSQGFHDQPLSVVQKQLTNGPCLNTCDVGAINGECIGRELLLSVSSDNNQNEINWRVKDQNGLTLYEGGDYSREDNSQVFEHLLCLGLGCFTLEFFAAHKNGYFTLSDTSGQFIAQGGGVYQKEELEFCLPLQNDNLAQAYDCLQINFEETPPATYGGGQDQGDYEIRDHGAAIRLFGNAWKSVPLDYEISPFTILEFDFGSTASAEIHAIGLDTDEAVSFNRTFKLFGNQNWGNLQYFNYRNPGEWQSFIIPVGLHLSGPVSRLFFCVDDDEAPQNGDSWFRNIRIYESGGCPSGVNVGVGMGAIPISKKPNLKIFPNPSREKITLELSRLQRGTADVSILNLTGQILKRKTIRSLDVWSRESLWVNDLPGGTYFVKLELGEEVWMEKIIVLE